MFNVGIVSYVLFFCVLLGYDGKCFIKMVFLWFINWIKYIEYIFKKCINVCKCILNLDIV